MSKNEEILSLFAKSEELLESLRRGRQFTEELLRENERLRLRNVQIEMEQTQSSDAEIAHLRIENEQLLLRIERLERRFMEMEAENRDFARQYVDIEAQNERLANLYVASFQLHSTLDLNEVVGIITEILLNLVGAEEFAIFTYHQDEQTLEWIGGELETRTIKKKMLPGSTIESQVALTKSTYRSDGEDDEKPLIAIPLKIKEEMVGVISIYKLLNHKPGFNTLDYELLNMLAGHAATALLSARLYQGTERKLRTIEGFMNLLRSQ